MKKLNYNHSIIKLISLVLFLSFLVSGCNRQIEPISKTAFLLDTVVTITLYDSADSTILDDCISSCKYYENLFSKTITTSDVSLINQAAGRPVTVSDDTIYLIQKAISYSELSNGAFDITIGPVSDLWDFKSENPKIPQSSKIQSALSHVDYTTIKVTDKTVQLKDPAAKIDLGGIAKGYIADQLKALLISKGVKNAMINLGGNVYALGSKENGTPYTIGIQKPFADLNTVLLSLPISNQSVVSSGPYERFFEKNGTLYHHIIDTTTGYPVKNDLYGVTILSDDSVDGDALSTTCFALGKKEGIELINSLSGVEAVFIDCNYQITYTDKDKQ
ncbi:MAG: FAD:protein FMN transferase [Lachnospiraceae bacterium]|nr:FAD:protein FMN transferase [Lachnospiraceae bacterium]